MEETPQNIVAMIEKPQPEGKEIIEAPYRFTIEEKLDLSQKMAKSHQHIMDIESNLQSVSKQLKADISKEEAEMEKLSNQITSGFEFRKTECRVVFNTKARKKKYFKILPEGSDPVPDQPALRESDMEPGDWQLYFPPAPKTAVADALNKAVEEKKAKPDPIQEAIAEVREAKEVQKEERERAFE